MITAHTAARIQAAERLYAARKIIEEQRSLICFEVQHLEYFAECMQSIDKLINRAMGGE